MFMTNKITLEQWRALVAVIDSGGYAQAAESLGKSQSAVTYAIQLIETRLELRVFALQGRKSVPTEAGELLYRRARQLIEEAEDIESAARRLSQGVEATVRVAVDVLLPSPLVLEALNQFAVDYPHTRVEFVESVLSGTDDALIRHDVELAIASNVPPGFVGDPILRVHMLAVATPDHPLFSLPAPITTEDLRRYRQLVVRDSGIHRRRSVGWLSAEQRWTVSHMQTSVQAVRQGLGYAWLPHTYIQSDLAEGRLRPLPLQEGAHRLVQLYRVYARRDGVGPATRALEATLCNAIRQQCIDNDEAILRMDDVPLN